MSSFPARTPGPIVRALAPAALLGALAALALAGPAAAAKPAPAAGAPQTAEVRFESLIGVPPEGYSLFCTSFPNCTSRGVIDLATEAELDVAYNPKARVTHGAGPLDYSTSSGDVSMAFTCDGEPDPFESRIGVTDTEPGELEIAGVRGVPGANTLAVALNHGGVSGGDFPQEIVSRSDGGCGSPVQRATQTMGTWYYHFYSAHRGEQQEVGNDLEVSGLTYRDGVFSKVYDRFVTIGTPGHSYPAYERTRIEVEPEYCAGKEHRIVSAVADGRSLGLDGMRFYAGQVVNVPPEAKFRLGDDSVIELEQGGSFTVTACETRSTVIALHESVGSFWVHVKKALAGSGRKFDVVTERAVIGVRGTIFEVAYDKPRQLTKVAVEESSVSLKGRNGARGKVIVKTGQVGVQKGSKRPRIVRG